MAHLPTHDPCKNPKVQAIFLLEFWRPDDLAMFHAPQESSFRPEDWAKLKSFNLISQLWSKRSKRTCLIKLFGRN